MISPGKDLKASYMEISRSYRFSFTSYIPFIKNSTTFHICFAVFKLNIGWDIVLSITYIIMSCRLWSRATYSFSVSMNLLGSFEVDF